MRYSFVTKHLSIDREMSCCGSTEKSTSDSPPKLNPLKNGSILFTVQLMKNTKNGKPVNMTLLKKAMTENDKQNILADPSLSSDMQTIKAGEFNVCNKLTKENLESLDINLIIKATYEWPKICPTIRGREVVNIRVPVDDISIYFDEVSDKIEENASKGGHTLVHCMVGASSQWSLLIL